MNKNEILFVGIGQAGNNIVHKLLESNSQYEGLFINTSVYDMLPLGNIKNKIIIPNLGGVAKNRDIAKKCLLNYGNGLMDKINEFPSQEYVYVCFSMGGGTGSGISPLLIRNLLKLNKKIGIVTILPNITEDRQSLLNCIECWNELIKVIPSLNSIYLLDNNKRKNKADINSEFAYLFGKFMNIVRPSIHGTIDVAEKRALASENGLSAIYDFNNVNTEQDFINAVMEQSIFATNTFNYKRIGINTNDEHFFELTNNILSGEILHRGYSEENLIVTSGGKINQSIINNFTNALKDNSSFEDVEVMSAIDISKYKTNNNNNDCCSNNNNIIAEDQEFDWGWD